MQIELNSQGLPTFTLGKDDDFLGNGSERVGYGENAGGPKPFVHFYPRTVPMPAASLAAGKPIFKSVVYMRLQHPGERDNIDRPATRDDAMKYPAQYRTYCEGRQGIPEGIPLDTLFPNHQDVREALNYNKIYTVEQLAGLNDTQVQNIGMGGHEWKQKALRYLAALKEGQGFAQHEEEIRKLRVESDRVNQANADLARQVAALTDQIARLLNTQPHGLAPGAAALPQHLQYQPAPAPMQHDGMFVKPGYGELGADDLSHMGKPAQPADIGNAPDTSFLGEAAEAAAAPAAETATRSRRRQ